MLEELRVLHGTGVTIRERYSSCRLTGHDPDIGTGNFGDTNYRTLRSRTNSPNDTVQANEVVESKRRKSIHTSTDQDGNYRVENYLEFHRHKVVLL